jgi:plasmid stabilization system protein ParE
VPDSRLEIRWLKRALANLDAEAAFIARDNPAAAARVVEAIAAGVELLAQHPALGRPGRVEGTRELVVPDTPYLVPTACAARLSKSSASSMAPASGRRSSERFRQPYCTFLL